MNIPRLVPRKKVTREKLIQSLPCDKWIAARNCELDITKSGFNQAMKAMPSDCVSHEYINGEIKFKIHSRSYKKLMDCICASYNKPRVQKITKNKLSIEDKLLNLFMLA